MIFRFIVLLCCLSTLSLHAQFELDLESGISLNTMNDVRFPNDETTSANLVDVPAELGTSSTLFYRLRASYTINEKHTLSGLYAPLQFVSEGSFGQPVRFGEHTYLPSELTQVTYKFNSYRLTYRYRIVKTEKVSFGLGVTAKIRDARIAFDAGRQSDETTDLGFVPLINFNFEVYPNEKLTFRLKGDALVGAQGRAEDIFAGVVYHITPSIGVKGGYRILEGGADVDQVYNFSLIHYAAVGALITF